MTKKVGPKLKNGRLSNLPIESLDFNFYMHCLEVFQYAGDILKVTVLIDHPVYSTL